MQRSHPLRIRQMTAGMLTMVFFTHPSQAQKAGMARVIHTFGIGASTSTFSQPIVRHPSGGEELPVDQSTQTVGIRASWFVFGGDRGAIELGLSYFKGSFDAFNFREQQAPTSQQSTRYTAPEVRLVFFDMAAHWAPSPKVPWSLYGVLGMGNEGEKYSISNATFNEWNGAKSNSGFQFSYGLGTRFFPIRNLSLFAEFRFVPGDLVSEGGTCYVFVQGSSSWDTCGGKFKNRSRLLSLGGALHFP